MFENWGFLMAEIWGLLLLAALVGLAAGWLIWGRRKVEAAKPLVIDNSAEIAQLRASLAATQAELTAERADYAKLEGEINTARAALIDARAAIAEVEARPAKVIEKIVEVPVVSGDKAALEARVAELEASLEAAQTEGAKLSDRSEELAEELAEHHRDAMLMVERVSTLEHELAQYRDVDPVSDEPQGDPTIGKRPEKLDAPRNGWGDDLTLIKGVGPVLEALLHRLGFYHFDQIASWNEEEVAWVDENLEGFKGRVTRDNWVEQSRELAATAS